MRRTFIAGLIVLTPLAAPAAAQDLEQARDLLGRAAKAEDPAEARDLARRAMPGFDTAVKAMPESAPDCWLLAATAEAHLRAGDARGARPFIDRGAVPACDAAAFASLSAWAHEHGADGTRRGKGADLRAAVALYLKAAELYRERPSSADAEAGALANAAEIALMLDDPGTARDAGLQGLRLAAARGPVVRCGVAVLAAEGPRSGEGAATDLVAQAVGGDMDLLREILDTRVAQVGAGLDARPGDPHLCASAGFYSLLRGDDVGLALARRHLETAAQSGFPIPDLAYLRGRVALRMGDRAKAHDFWRQQQKEYPAVSASRLAANDLALDLAEAGGEAAEMQGALRAVDAWIAQRDEEAALQETRGLLLERMGRRDEALAAMLRSEQLEPSPEKKAVIARLRSPR